MNDKGRISICVTSTVHWDQVKVKCPRCQLTQGQSQNHLYFSVMTCRFTRLLKKRTILSC